MTKPNGKLRVGRTSKSSVELAYEKGKEAGIEATAAAMTEELRSKERVIAALEKRIEDRNAVITSLLDRDSNVSVFHNDKRNKSDLTDTVIIHLKEENSKETTALSITGESGTPLKVVAVSYGYRKGETPTSFVGSIAAIAKAMG